MPSEISSDLTRAWLARDGGRAWGQTHGHAAGTEVTIHALWVALADRTGQDGEPDVKAAAALAGMVITLRRRPETELLTPTFNRVARCYRVARSIGVPFTSFRRFSSR
ncbi:MAG: hypothetical protein ACRYHQ_15930 [Janthinobacterium lividum]